MSPTAAAVQGACPSVHRPFHQLDGELLRIRLPGGRLDAAQAQVVAEAAPGAALELTGRGNLQLRGVRAGALASVVDRLVAARLVHPDPGIDARHNLMATPAAGIDPDELLDVRPLLAELSTVLARHDGPALPPTFGLLLDGGGRVHLRGRPAGIALGAVRDRGGDVLLEVRAGRGLPTWHDPSASVPVVRPEVAAEVVADSLRVGGTINAGAVGWRSGRDLAPLAPSPVPVPLGLLRQRQAGRVAIGVLPLLGRLGASELAHLAALALQHGDGELRLTPWRSFLLAGVAAEDADPLLEELAGRGFVVSSEDPAAHVVACAGSTGCPSGLADCQADARAVVAELRAEGVIRSVHVSGCDKRCAGPRPAAHNLTFVAGPEPGQYHAVGADGEVLAERLGASDLAAFVCHPGR